MIYIVFVIMVVGIFALKFARKLLQEERLIRKRKERKVEWDKKQKRKSHGKRVHKRNKPPKRKR